MKAKIVILALALGASTCLLTAQDSDPGPDRQLPPGRRGGPGGPGGPEAMGRPRPVLPLIQVLDLNKDGTIDAEEISKAGESLKELDKNKDGKITPDEYRPPRPESGRGPGRSGPDAPQERGGGRPESR